MLLHFIHEEQYLETMALSSLEAQRNTGKKFIAEVLKIEAGLISEDVHAALRLRPCASDGYAST